MASPGPAHTSLVRKQMDTMAPTRPTELHESTSPADLPEPTSPASLRQQARPTGLQKPIRPTALQKRCVSLTAGPTAPGIARGQVRATIAAWDIPIDTSVAILLTSELVTNAVMHEAGETINLVITCGYGQLGVDVHDTSCELPVPVDGPPDAETGRRSEEHTSELQSRGHLVCRLLLEKKKKNTISNAILKKKKKTNHKIK